MTHLPATPRRIYQAWLNSEGHGAFTGAEAEVEPRVGGRHRAWDGYISGRILELEANRRIVMTWRTTEFSSGSPDSRVEVLLEADKGGTRLTLLHSQLPAGDGPEYEAGWKENYFEPMRLYFGRQARRRAAQGRPKVKRAARGRRGAPSRPRGRTRRAKGGATRR